MALPLPPAPPARVRDARSMVSDRRTGRRLVSAWVLARMSLLVLTGRASVGTECVGHDRRLVEHRYGAGRRVDVVLAGWTDIDGRLQHQRMPSLRPPAPGRQASLRLLLVKESTVVWDRIGSPDSPAETEEGRLLGARRAGSAAAMSGTLVVAGLIAMLGVYGATASIVHSVTGPVRRVVHVLHAPEKARRGSTLRPTTLQELHTMARAVEAAGDDPLGAARENGDDARNLTTASEGPTATSGPSCSSADELPTPAVGGSPLVTGRHESVPETRSAGTVVASVAQQARLVALDATIERARSGGADAGFAVIAPRGDESADQAAQAAEYVTAASTPAASSVATTRYVAARSRAVGPTTALWHAVELDRLVGATGGACETTVCGSLVRVSADQRWPVPARDVCPACSAVAH